MERLWLITNHGSGSADAEKAAAIETVCVERGLRFVGRTVFPAEPLPSSEALDAAGVDTVVLFAGDGTINAAACSLDGWKGQALVLPGGTMNMLARDLHGDSDAEAIIHAAHRAPWATSLRFVEAGPHRAFVAMIAGPATTWAHAREMVREGKIGRLWRAVRFAWRRSWAGEVTVFDGRRRRARCNAVIVTAAADGALDVSAITAERWSDIARLGWEWLKGDWHAAANVDDSRACEAALAGRRAIHALFDGEEAKLPSPVLVRAGLSELKFLRTVEGE